MSSIQGLKQRVWNSNRELPELGLVIQAFGNVSGIDREQGLVAIKPSGILYDELGVDDVVVVDLDNNVVEGRLRPSSDTRTHTICTSISRPLGGSFILIPPMPLHGPRR